MPPPQGACDGPPSGQTGPPRDKQARLGTDLEAGLARLASLLEVPRQTGPPQDGEARFGTEVRPLPFGIPLLESEFPSYGG